VVLLLYGRGSPWGSPGRAVPAIVPAAPLLRVPVRIASSRRRRHWIAERVDQRRLGPAGAAHRRDHRLRRGRLFAGLQRESRNVLLRLALAEFHVQHRHADGVEWNDVEDPHLGDLAAVRAQPPAPFEPASSTDSSAGALGGVNPSSQLLPVSSAGGCTRPLFASTAPVRGSSSENQ